MNNAVSSRSGIARKLLHQIIIWLLALSLLGWVASQVPLVDTWRALRQLTLVQIGVLLLVNALVVMLFSARWWTLLRALGQRVPYGSLTLHRLAGFGVSYFTPGPQFGGEPVQVLLAKRRHSVPTAPAVASVGLDRVLEVLINLSVLVAGLAVTLSAQLVASSLGILLLIPVGMLLTLPAAYLFLLWQGRMPLTNALKLLPDRIQRRALYWRVHAAVRDGEVQATRLLRGKPWSLVAAVLASLASWVGIVAEYWLMLVFLDVTLTPVQLISILTAARIAILLPLPGGLGTLEAGHVLIFGALGLNPAVGLSASLLIRGRDILFGLAGLGWAGMNWNRAQDVEPMDDLVVSRMASARIPTSDGEFELFLYTDNQDAEEHLALVMGDPGAGYPLLARVHSECFTGDVLGSRRCDCGDQLSQAMRLVAKEGAGVVIYLRQEGRGIGLIDKLKSYNLQDEGYDTVEANLLLGHAPDERDYTIAARIFDDLGVQAVRLMTNNPEKIGALEQLGIEVADRVSLQADIHSDNARYLWTKANRLDHMLDAGIFRHEASSIRPERGIGLGGHD